jgi:predicted 3-demethylubiquinone-9 3-methyltransferase (glyoxalase superfamily)
MRASGSLKQFKLENQRFFAMDSGLEHNYDFNEAFSIMVECESRDKMGHFFQC